MCDCAIKTKLAEGKTKIIWAAESPKYVIIENKDDITAGDGEFHDIIQGKGMYNNEIACNCFRLLREKGSLTHYVQQIDAICFLAERMTMIPIEVVIRRINEGSYSKRHSDVEEGKRFNHLVVEFFLKDDKNHDPLMIWDKEQKCFFLFDPKKSKENGFLEKYDRSKFQNIVQDFLSRGGIVTLSALAQNAFAIIEKAWENQNVVLVDLKIEFGINKFGNVKIADVISNDEWRIWPGGDKSQMKDKEVYRRYCREGKITSATLAKISENYRWVAEQTAKFI